MRMLNTDQATINAIKDTYQKSFDEGLAQLKGLATNPDLVNIGNINTLIAETTIKEQNAFKKLYRYELLLKGNLNTAHEILLLKILKEKGGYAFNIDALPMINNNLFDPNALELDNFFDKIETKPLKQLILQMVLDKLSLQEPSAMPTRKTNLESNEITGYIDQTTQGIDQNLLDYIQGVINNPENSKKLFNPLGETLVDPLLGFAQTTPQNGAMAAIKDSLYIQKLLSNRQDLIQIFRDHNIDGLNESSLDADDKGIPLQEFEELPKVASTEFKAALTKIGLNDLFAPFFLNYRWGDVLSGFLQADFAMTGWPAHAFVMASLLEPDGIAPKDYAHHPFTRETALTPPPLNKAVLYYQEFNATIRQRQVLLFEPKINYDGTIVLSFSRKTTIVVSDLTFG